MKDYHSLKPMNTNEWENRLELMKCLTNKHVSEVVHLTIEQILKSSQNKEKKAKDLTQILIEAKNENQLLSLIKSVQS